MDKFEDLKFYDKKNLDEQLLPGLGSKGISKSFKNSIYSFNYNDIKSLEKVFSKNKNNIGIIIMEPMRFTKPKNNSFRASPFNLSNINKLSCILFMIK